jgi:hypothetical protein
MMDELIVINLMGSDIAPTKISSRELADILITTEEMIASEVIADHPTLKKEEINISLINVGQGSINLGYFPQIPELELPAYKRIANAISDNNLAILSEKTIESLKKFPSICKKHGCTVNLYSTNGTKNKLAEISSESQFDIYPEITGETILYGVVTRVGGKDPHVQITLLDGTSLTTETTQEIAIALAKSLYHMAAMECRVKWRLNSYTITEAKILKVLDYNPQSLTESINNIRDQFGHYFDGITDPDKYVADQREDEISQYE